MADDKSGEPAATAATPNHPHEPGMQVLEREVPLSQSVLWRRQRDYYSQRGLKAWTVDQVPSYITNNALMADIDVSLVAAFLDDCMHQPQAAPISAENPLRILEPGAGTGKFAFLFLRKLTALLRDRKVPPEFVRYVMSDCGESLLKEWESNESLAEFAQSGALQFQLIGEELKLKNQPPSSTGPVVVIANYLFDSLPQDAFYIREGKILEALVTTSSPRADAALGELQLAFSERALETPKYQDPSWNKILEHYRSRFSSATVLFPSATLSLLKRETTDGPMLVIAADRGVVHEDEVALLQGPPPLDFHSAQCFSQMVNFNAIARCFWDWGGDALLPQRHFSSLSICGFLLGGGSPFTATKAAYRQCQQQMGPDDVFTLLGWLHPHMQEMNPGQILAMLKLTAYDSVALQQIMPVLMRQVRNIHPERNDLRNAVLRCWNHHFPLTAADKSMAFNCGVILLELKFFAEAHAMFSRSEKVLGRSAPTSYNLGLCELGLGRRHKALTFMADAVEQDPAFEPARQSLTRLKNESN